MSSRISHKQRLLRFFPTPRVLAMPAVGVDISDEYIRIISLVPGSKSRELALWAEQKLPQGTIEDGIINNSKEVISTLSSLKKEHDLEFVHASLPDEKTYIFRADIPTATDAEVQTAIEFKIQENVPLSPTEVIFDYTPIVSHQATTVS
jgi:Tfp pilus assembly PilM family ATPase